MNKKFKNFIISSFFILFSIVFTILVKVIDVRTIGANGSKVGFASLNKAVFDTLGVNMRWYHITDILGKFVILIALFYAFIGILQLVKRKKISKVDKEIVLLGIFYVVVVAIYAFFEKVVINYRPILLDGKLEASFPSSHTMLVLCVCISAVLVNKRLFKDNYFKIFNVLLILIAFVTIVGRLVSGVHWCSDIIGGVIISGALLMTFYSFLCLLDDKKN